MKEKMLKRIFWSVAGLAAASLVGSFSLMAIPVRTKVASSILQPNSSLTFSQQKFVSEVNSNQTSENDLMYEPSQDQNAYAVTGFTSEAAQKIVDGYTLNIPNVHDGKPVTKIARGAFACGTPTEYSDITQKQGADKITHVIIPPNVSLIDIGSFYASSMLDVQFNEGLTTINARAFSYTGYLQKVSFPHSLKYINEAAFWGSAIKSINLASVDEIKNNGFCDCGNLQTVLIADPKGKCKFYGHCFFKCTELTSFTLLNSHPTIVLDTSKTDWMFAACDEKKLKVWVNGTEAVESFKKQSGAGNVNAITAEKDLFLQHEGTSNKVASLTETGRKASELTIPASVEEIIDYGLDYCSNKLNKITIRGANTKISSNALLSVPKTTKFYIYSDHVKNELISILGKDAEKRIFLPKAPLSAGTIATIVVVVVVLAIAGLGTGIIIPLRRQHKVNVLNSKLTNRRIDRLATSNAMAFKKVVEATGVLSNKVDQIRALGATKQPRNVAPQPGQPVRPVRPVRPRRPIPPQGF